MCVCAALPTHGHTRTAPASLVIAELSPVSSSVHSVAAALFTHLSAGSTVAPPSAAPLQRAALLTTPSGSSAVPQLQLDSVTIPVPPLQVPSSCLGTSNPPDTVLLEATSALLAHLSAVTPALAPVGTALEDKSALRRQINLSGEGDIMLARSSLPECLIEIESIGKYWKRTRTWSGYYEVLKRKAGALETQPVALATSSGELSPALLVNPIKPTEKSENGSAPLRVPDK